VIILFQDVSGWKSLKMMRDLWQGQKRISYIFKDGTGSKGQGPKDGHGKGKGKGNSPGQGPMTGGKKGIKEKTKK